MVKGRYFEIGVSKDFLLRIPLLPSAQHFKSAESDGIWNLIFPSRQQTEVVLASLFWIRWCGWSTAFVTVLVYICPKIVRTAYQSTSVLEMKGHSYMYFI